MSETTEQRLQDITDMLILVRDNLQRGMSKSIQKLQARSINEVLGLESFTSSPPLRPLTDEQIRAVIAKIDPNEHYLPNSLRQLARAVEAAHGIN